MLCFTRFLHHTIKNTCVLTTFEHLRPKSDPREPKRNPKWAKIGPRGFQDGPPGAQGRRKIASEGPNKAQGAPRDAQNGTTEPKW